MFPIVPGIMSQMKDGTVKDWFDDNVEFDFLNKVVMAAEKRGFTLDTESGMLLRQVYDKYTRENLGYTIIDIITLRPVDVHRHKDVSEALYMVDGEGIILTEKKSTTLEFYEHAIFPGKNFFIPVNTAHTFRPDKGESLEIRLACTGILNPKQEECIESFDKFHPWIDYYKKFQE